MLVDCAQPIQRVALGAGEVAEATAISPTEIMITGKGAGVTSLIIWDIHGGRQFFNVTVRSSTGLTGDKLDAHPARAESRAAGRGHQSDLQQQQRFFARHGEGSDQFGARGADCLDRAARW